MSAPKHLADDNIQIVTGADERFFPGLFATLVSMLISSRKSQHFSIYIFDGGLSLESKKLLTSSTRAVNQNVTIEFLGVDLKKFQRFASMAGNFMAYARLLIPESIESPKVLWLDSDLLVLCDVCEIWALDLKDSYAAAALEDCAFGEDILNYKMLGLDYNSPYYNTGVLLLNSKELRKNNFTERSIDYLKKNIGKYLWYDQSAINVVLHNKIQTLYPRFNLHSRFFNKNPTIQHISGQGHIFHYLQRPKPWQKFSAAPHALLLYDLLRAFRCPAPQLQGLSNAFERLKWVMPKLTLAYYKAVSYIRKDRSERLKKVVQTWETNCQLKALSISEEFVSYRISLKNEFIKYSYPLSKT